MSKILYLTVLICITLGLLPHSALADDFVLKTVLDSECVLIPRGGAMSNCLYSDGPWQLINSGYFDPALVKKSKCVAFLLQDLELDDNIIQSLGELGIKRKLLLINSTEASEMTKIAKRSFNFDIISAEFKCNGFDHVNWVKNRHMTQSGDTLQAINSDKIFLKLLSQRPLNLGIANIKPFNIIHKDGTVTGFDADMWKIVAKKLSIDLKFKQLPMLEHSKKIRNGTIDASSMSLGFPSIKGVHVSPSLNQRENFLIGKPPGVKKRDEAFIDPFNRLVWLFLVIAFFGMWSGLIFVSQMSPHVNLDLFETLTLVMCIMFKEPIPESMIRINKSLARNILLFMWLLTASLLSMAYSSNLLASLVKEEQEKPIDTFQDILDKDITVYFNGKTPAHITFGKSSVSIVKEVYEKQVLAKPGAVYRMPDNEVFEFATKIIASGKGIFDNIEIRQHGVKHLFRRGKQLTFASIPTFYRVTVNNPVIYKFNEEFLRMIENGIYRGYLQAKYIFNMEFREREFYRREPPRQTWHKLSLIHLKTMFYAFVIPAMAIVVFVIETGVPSVVTKTINKSLVQCSTFFGSISCSSLTFGMSRAMLGSVTSLRSIKSNVFDYRFGMTNSLKIALPPKFSFQGKGGTLSPINPEDKTKQPKLDI